MLKDNRIKFELLLIIVLDDQVALHNLDDELSERVSIPLECPNK